jgi:hypothetical protein
LRRRPLLAAFASREAGCATGRDAIKEKAPHRSPEPHQRSQRPSGRTRSPPNRGISHAFRKSPQLRECVVADAVAFEPVSTLEFPANREKNREFHQIRALGAILKAADRITEYDCAVAGHSDNHRRQFRKQGRPYLRKPTDALAIRSQSSGPCWHGKATFLLALMWIVSPVAGLRPMRAARLRTCRMPSPVEAGTTVEPPDFRLPPTVQRTDAWHLRRVSVFPKQAY